MSTEDSQQTNELSIVPSSSSANGTLQVLPLNLTSIGPINFVTGAQNVRIIQDYTIGLAEPSPEEKQKKVDEFEHEVNSRTRSQTVSTISKNFDGDIEEPKNLVAPVLVTTNFFRGDAALGEVDYTVPNERGRKKKKKRKKKAREVEVHLKDIHKKERYVALVGGAGSGKTTLTKRYCRMVLDKEILEGVKFVHLINIRDLSKEELTPESLLFGKFIVGKHKEECVKYGYEWMQKEENQEQILLAFDGMDTAPWMLSEDDHELITYGDKRSAATIIYNILHGHLFPKCKILLTSREYGITKFPRAIRPDAVIALKGFTRQSIMTLVKELGGDKGDDIWETLLRKSLNLMLLCSTPLFLIFTIIVYKKYENPPENLSGIIITIVESHIRSEHRHVKDVRAIMEKLKVLSLEALVEGRVVFSAIEFANYELNVEDVKDLVIHVPTPNPDAIGNQKLLEEDYSYFFCHQSFQESLGALRVAGMAYKAFEEFVRAYLHEPKYIVVRQILCGVLFNEETTRLARPQANIVDKKQKQDLVLSTLKQELVANKDSSMDMLNLLISLRECGAQEEVVRLIKQSLPSISLSGIPLTPSDVHAAASVARQCDKLAIMQLVNCHLDNHALEVLAKGMRGSDVEITVFDVSFNLNLRKNSMYYLHEICIRGQGLNYWQCGFRQSDILNFNEVESEQRTKEASEPSDEEVIKRRLVEDDVLELSSYNVENHLGTLKDMVKICEEKSQVRLNVVDYEISSDITTLCDLIKDCKNITEFALSESELNEAQLICLKTAIAGKQIETLNVFLNPEILEKGWRVLGEIVAASSIKNLFITKCGLAENKLKEFKSAIRECKIHKFDLSRNDDMDEKCLGQIGQIVVGCEVKELVMGYCAFTSEHIKHLNRSISKGKINRIDMSGNDKMGRDGFYALGEIVYSCEVKLLDISECDPSSEEVEQFKDATSTAKITKLNVSRNRRMGKDGLKYVGEMVGKNVLDELFIRQCELEQHTLGSFQKGLGEAKIRHLDLGFYFMKVRPTTEVELGILMEILPNVTEQLTINDWDISVRGRQALQDKIDSLPFRGEGLKIMFNRGKDDYIRQKRRV